MTELEFKQAKPDFDNIIDNIYSKKSHLSYSSFKTFIENGPRGFFEHKMYPQTSKAMESGIAFHVCCLEPERFDEEYFVFDDTEKYNELINKGNKSPRLTSEYKTWKNLELQKYTDKKEISIEEYKLYCSMRDYLRINSLTSPFFKNKGENEVVHNFEYKDFNWTCRIDRETAVSTIDLKKVANASTKKMRWTISENYYDIQGAVNCLATGIFNHYIINIDESHQVSVFNLRDENMQLVIDRLGYFIQRFRECIESDSWYEGNNYFFNEIQTL